jgi:hypothetical protein
VGDDRGSGLLSAFAGILAFLVFLFFCVQLLTGLFARSMVSDVARAGATSVAGARVDRSDPDAVETAQREAEARMRDRLGTLGNTATFDWSGTDDDHVEMRVQARSPRFMFGSFRGALVTDSIDRTVWVRVEELR